MRSAFQIACLISLLFACSGHRANTLPFSEVPDVIERVRAAELGAGDVVEVRVYMEEGLSGLYRVNADGCFEFPLVGVVKAEGLTSGQLATEICDRLKEGYLRNPQVSVFVKEFNSKKVIVWGAVQKAGAFKYEDDMTIVQAVSLAGGLKSVAAKNSVVLTRILDGQEHYYQVPFEEIGLGRAQNVHLQPGDIIFVPESLL